MEVRVKGEGELRSGLRENLVRVTGEEDDARGDISRLVLNLPEDVFDDHARFVEHTQHAGRAWGVVGRLSGRGVGLVLFPGVSFRGEAGAWCGRCGR